MKFLMKTSSTIFYRCCYRTYVVYKCERERERIKQRKEGIATRQTEKEEGGEVKPI